MKYIKQDQVHTRNIGHIKHFETLEILDIEQYKYYNHCIPIKHYKKNTISKTKIQVLKELQIL